MHNAVELYPLVSDFVGKDVIKTMTDGVVIVLPDAEGARVLTVNKLFTSMFI